MRHASLHAGAPRQVLGNGAVESNIVGKDAFISPSIDLQTAPVSANGIALGAGEPELWFVISGGVPDAVEQLLSRGGPEGIETQAFGNERIKPLAVFTD